jgi:hypothetical protein
MVEAHGYPKQRKQGQGGKTGGDKAHKGQRRSVEVQPNMVKALQVQKMDFQSHGRPGTGQKAQETELLEQETQANKTCILRIGRGGITWRCPQRVQSLEVA